LELAEVGQRKKKRKKDDSWLELGSYISSSFRKLDRSLLPPVPFDPMSTSGFFVHILH
jgi:hypothetical protein